MARALNVRIDFLMADMGLQPSYSSAKRRADELKDQIRPAWMRDMATVAQAIGYYALQKSRADAEMRSMDVAKARRLVEKYTAELEIAESTNNLLIDQEKDSIRTSNRSMLKMKPVERDLALAKIQGMEATLEEFKEHAEKDHTELKNKLETARSKVKRYAELYRLSQKAAARLNSLHDKDTITEFSRTRQAWLVAANQVPQPTERETIEEYAAKFQKQHHTPYDAEIFSFYYERYSQPQNDSQYQTARQRLLEFIRKNPTP